jgi:hypothetical protein
MKLISTRGSLYYGLFLEVGVTPVQITHLESLDITGDMYDDINVKTKGGPS